MPKSIEIKIDELERELVIAKLTLTNSQKWQMASYVFWISLSSGEQSDWTWLKMHHLFYRLSLTNFSDLSLHSPRIWYLYRAQYRYG